MEIRTAMQIFCDICRNVARTLWKYGAQRRLISFSTRVLTVLFLARNHMTVILHPLFSPDLAHLVFFLSLLKTQLITQERFGDIIMSKKTAHCSCRGLPHMQVWWSHVSLAWNCECTNCLCCSSKNSLTNVEVSPHSQEWFCTFSKPKLKVCALFLFLDSFAAVSQLILITMCWHKRAQTCTKEEKWTETGH